MISALRSKYVALALATFALITLASCARRSEVRGHGTIEIDEIDVASLVGGRVARLAVDEGDSVRAGDTLVVLDRGEVGAALTAQAAQAEKAAAQYQDMRSGPRTPEIISARAQAAAANSAVEITEREFQRMQELMNSHVISASELDRSKSARDAAVARRDAASEQLKLLENGFRKGQIDAAQHGLEVARAELLASRSRAGELVLVAPSNGIVLLRNFEVGEIAAPGQAVVTLGDPDRLWMRVYLAAPELPRVHRGDAVEATVMGSKQSFKGHVVEIATEAEFTPRSALTEEERANLVFGVKVRFDPTAGVLKPGLPAEARFPGAQP